MKIGSLQAAIVDKNNYKKLYIYVGLVLAFIFIVSVLFLNESSRIADDVFKSALTNFIKHHSQYMKHVSVYLYAFNTNKEISINGDYTYMPASLGKVPCMIAYYKLAETNPEILKKRLVEQNDIDIMNQNIPPEKRLQPGKEYTIDDLINHMILYSDNDAFETLSNSMDTNTFNSIFTDLHIAVPDFSTMYYSISITDYANFFKVLYYSSYLTKSMSQKAITLLENSEFRQGLVAGVPKGIKIAHKFGERIIEERNESQFHECGIVYVPHDPYLLCVMTDGNNLQQQSKLVKDISAFVYHDIQKITY